MAADLEWGKIAGKMHVITLGWAAKVLIPSLLLSSLPQRTRGLTFDQGRSGFLIGGMLVIGSVGLGTLLTPSLGYAVIPFLFWLLGTTGVAMAATSLTPIAFVKPICTRCRLLPVIKEHEAIHLSGIANEDKVWASMRTRHSVQSLALEGDPAICTFCPIPKRLKES